MEIFGCTTPFGPNKTEVCTNKSLFDQASRLYQDGITQSNSKCLLPCSTVIPTYAIRKRSLGFAKPMIELEFPSKINVIKAFPAYTLLSLIAEIGGYVGLFLGVSVLDLKNFTRFAKKKFTEFFNKN